MIGWYLGVVGVLIGIIGGFYFVMSSLRTSGELKKGVGFLVAASLFYVFFSAIMVAFGIIGYEISNAWWQIVPVIYLVSSILFAIGSNSLAKLFDTISEKGK